MSINEVALRRLYAHLTKARWYFAKALRRSADPRREPLVAIWRPWEHVRLRDDM